MSQAAEVPAPRPPVTEEDLNQTYNRLGRTGPPKTATEQVMERCEREGTVAPSVFGRARSGAETALNSRSAPARK